MVLNNKNISIWDFINEQFNLVKEKERKSYKKREVVATIKLMSILSDKIKQLLTTEDLLICVSVISKLYAKRRYMEKQFRTMSYLEFVGYSYDAVITTLINNKIMENSLQMSYKLTQE